MKLVEGACPVQRPQPRQPSRGKQKEDPKLSGFFVMIDQVIVIDNFFADLNKFYNLQANTER
jgi:hypothetical protein